MEHSYDRHEHSFPHLYTPHPSLSNLPFRLPALHWAQPLTAMSWDPPSGYIHNCCTSDSDWLEDEKGYYPWQIWMKSGFEYCEMWGVVSGTETHLAPGLQLGGDIWDKKDRLTKVILSKSVKSELIIKITGATTSHEAWNLLETEYSQTGSGSLMLWFRRLTRQLSPSGDVLAHVSGFQEAIQHLTNANFQIPSYIAAAILLSMLLSDPRDPTSWNDFVLAIKIDLTTTTLLSVISGILKEKRRLTEDDQATSHKHETAYTALEHKAHAQGKKLCMNCTCEGHWSWDCYSSGSVKEHEHPCKSNRSRGKKRKGKEKANHIDDGRDGGSNNETSNHVWLEECLMTTDFSNYLMSDKLSAPSYSITNPRMADSPIVLTGFRAWRQLLLTLVHPPTFTPNATTSHH